MINSRLNQNDNFEVQLLRMVTAMFLVSHWSCVTSEQLPRAFGLRNV